MEISEDKKAIFKILDAIHDAHYVYVESNAVFFTFNGNHTVTVRDCRGRYQDTLVVGEYESSQATIDAVKDAIHVWLEDFERDCP